jgi:hypothetical protein
MARGVSRIRFSLGLALLLCFALLHPARGAAALPPAASGDTWIQVQSSSFVCYSNGDQALVTDLLRDLERLREVLEKGGAGIRVQTSIPSYFLAFRDLDSFAPYNLKNEAGVPLAQGYFVPGGDVDYLAIALPTGGGANPLIYHEFVHSVLHSGLPGVPLWLNEGLAEFYSTFRSHGLSAEIGMPIPHRHSWLKANPMFDLETLLSVTTQSRVYTEPPYQQTFYAQSWALTHMLAQSGLAAGRFREFLARIGDGVHPSSAFSISYGGAPHDSITGALASYLAQPELPYRSYRFTQNFEKAPVQVSTVSRPEILYLLGDLLLRTSPVHAPEAREYFETALQLDSGHVPSLVGMGRIAEIASVPGEADRWFGRATEHEPPEAHAFYWSGRALVDRFYRASPGWGVLQPETPPSLLRARALLERSLQIEEGQPEVLAALSRTYVFEWGAEAVPGLRAAARAARRLPVRSDVLVVLAALTANTGNREAATALIEERIVPSEDQGRIEAARSAVFRADLMQAQRWIESGKQPQAEGLLKSVVEQTTNPAIRMEARRLLATPEERAAQADLVRVYNLGVEALSEGDFHSARTHFEMVRTEAQDPELRRAAEARMVEIQFNEGLTKADNLLRMGRRTDARAQLDILSHLPLSQEQRDLLEQLREELR